MATSRKPGVRGTIVSTNFMGLSSKDIIGHSLSTREMEGHHLPGPPIYVTTNTVPTNRRAVPECR